VLHPTKFSKHIHKKFKQELSLSNVYRIKPTTVHTRISENIPTLQLGLQSLTTMLIVRFANLNPYLPATFAQDFGARQLQRIVSVASPRQHLPQSTHSKLQALRLEPPSIACNSPDSLVTVVLPLLSSHVADFPSSERLPALSVQPISQGKAS
jgi:hypothetical protein